MNNLLTRDEFREAVFKRDGHSCVICKKPARDSHHILDRKLFSDGGYYINNGASLCGDHHLEAEKSELTVEEIRTAAGITEIILPPDLNQGVVYDKWGQEVDLGIISRKYGRTYHFNFSPGTTSDDRISHNHWDLISKIEKFVLTEKLDGENNCLSEYGVFARSHAATTTSKWTQDIRQRWEGIKYDLKGGVQIFLENLYAIHSIEYRKLEHHYYVFAVRIGGKCLSWEEVEWWAKSLDLPTVPVLGIIKPSEYTEESFKQKVISLATVPSEFQSYDYKFLEDRNTVCTREGIVGANMDEYLLKDFDKNVFKYVRAKHVKTDEHWSMNWKRANLIWEKQYGR